MKLESILCVPHGALLSEIKGNKGFIPLDKDACSNIFAPENLWFVPRPHAEEDDGFKQVIPYSIVTSDELVLIYRRTPKGGEARLHDRFSIGAGGHINVTDALVNKDEAIDFTSTIALATGRELEEELGIKYSDITDINPIGLIYDDRDAVGRVHLGYVQVIRVKSQIIDKVEDHLENVSFNEIGALADYYENMESWSQLASTYVQDNKENLL